MDTASASASANCPASSMISTSKGSARSAAFANVHAVPPTRWPFGCSARQLASAVLLFGCSQGFAGSAVFLGRLAEGTAAPVRRTALSTFSTALWLVEVTATFLPLLTRCAMSRPAR